MARMQKVLTCLWFDQNAEQAVTFYVSLVEDSRVVRISRYGTNGRLPTGTVMNIEFDIGGTRFIAMNGGPTFRHSPAASILIRCDTQVEIDRLWAALTTNGGAELQCGWLTDRYGVSWQIVPIELGDMIHDPDVAKVDRVIAAIETMKKLNVDEIAAAFRGGEHATETGNAH